MIKHTIIVAIICAFALLSCADARAQDIKKIALSFDDIPRLLYISAEDFIADIDAAETWVSKPLAVNKILPSDDVLFGDVMAKLA